MIQALPLSINVCIEPDIVHFAIESGGVVCAYHAKSGVGGGVLLPESSLPRVRTVVWGFLNELVRIADCEFSELEVKIAGSGKVVEALQRAAADMKLAIKGQHISTEQLIAYFYTDSGRLRVQSTESTKTQAVREPEPEPMTRKKVLIVDDSKAIRKILFHIFSMDPDLEVVGAAESGAQIETMIADLKPDVVTMDIHMPDMNGVTILEKLLPKFAIPVVMISSVSMEAGSEVMRALELGAVDYIQKPTFSEIEVVGPQIAERVKLAASIKVQRKLTVLSSPGVSAGLDQSFVIAIGSSTGGTEALRQILTRLPADIPPIVIVQHIPPIFSAAFAKRMNELCPFEVKEAQDGDVVQPGRALIAPGGLQMRLTGKVPNYRVKITDEPGTHRHRPSADVLFESVAEVAGKNAIGAILTGMGTDGARGLLKMYHAGARTVAQDEASCVVFGMPKEAIRLGATEAVASLDAIPEMFMKWLKIKQAA